LPALLGTALDAGLELSNVDEAGPPGGLPDVFAFAARRPA
jgi:hypothetical protein